MNARSTDKTLLAAYGLAVFGGVIIFLGWAGFGIWPLELVALVPFWAAIELAKDRTWKAVLALSWTYGTIGNAGGYHWLVEFFEVFSGFGFLPSAAIFGVFAVYLGAQYAGMGVLYWGIRRRGWGIAAAGLSAFLLAEWLFPKLFPIYLSNTLLQVPILVQTADLGGPLLVTALIGLVNVAVFETLRWWLGARSVPVGTLLVSTIFVAFTLLYGAIRIAQVDQAVADAPTFEVGLIQVNMGIFEKRKNRAEGHRRLVEQSLELEADGALDLLVWPESAFGRKLPRDLPMTAAAVQQDIRTPILFGALSVSREGGRRRVYNTAFLVDEEGIVRESYDKTFLLMFGEYLPFGETFPVLYDVSPNSGRFTPGSHLDPLTLGPWRISTPICYEDVLPGFTRRMVRHADPHLLINLTNDAWFGDTQEPWIHLVLSQFRAIEHRRYLVRSTNTGISAIIDPVGRIVARTGVETRENLRGTVRMMDGQTMYAYLGDWPGWLSLVGVVVMLFRRRLRRIP
ncbi:MAG: apolipoprotein N-acyltransferase [Polyangiales bacterium]